MENKRIVINYLNEKKVLINNTKNEFLFGDSYNKNVIKALVKFFRYDRFNLSNIEYINENTFLMSFDGMVVDIEVKTKKIDADIILREFKKHLNQLTCDTVKIAA
ncbi:hypothetical protein KAR91_24660 [Candidatus Pacearchaeota archaeon]|nr:hypothetical protein [Candidatus Pacearchaeota archaeon]